MTNEKPTVIIVDTSDEFRVICISQLRKYGIEVIGEASNEDEAVIKIVRNTPDIVISEMFLSKSDGVQLIQKVKGNLGYDSPSFVMLSTISNKTLFEECFDAGASYCMVKPPDFELLANRIIKISKKFQQSNKNGFDLEKQTTAILRKMGFPAHIKGFRYVRSAIITATNDPETIDFITKSLYPTVAKQEKATPNRVERAIRHALTLVWETGDIDTLEEFFGSAKRKRPTNAEFIAVISDHLRLKSKIDGNSD